MGNAPPNCPALNGEGPNRGEAEVEDPLDGNEGIVVEKFTIWLGKFFRYHSRASAVEAFGGNMVPSPPGKDCMGPLKGKVELVMLPFGGIISRAGSKGGTVILVGREGLLSVDGRGSWPGAVPALRLAKMGWSNFDQKGEKADCERHQEKRRDCQRVEGHKSKISVQREM